MYVSDGCNTHTLFNYSSVILSQVGKLVTRVYLDYSRISVDYMFMNPKYHR